MILPWSTGLTVVCLGAGLILALIFSPADYQQGESVRIMYVHVPSAWMAMFVYAFLAAASAVGLIWKITLADLFAKACSPVGACFTFIALATGSLWGKPMWGTWWAWDARMTSVLILLFLYLGYIALSNAFEDATRGARAAAILALVGAINLPIIKFSVDWWNTLHQPASVSGAGTPAIHASMLAPLLLMGVAFTTFFVSVVILRVRSEIVACRIRALRMDRVQDRDHEQTPRVRGV